MDKSGKDVAIEQAGVLAPIACATDEERAAFARLGLYRVVDLLFHFPRRYEDFTQLRRVAELKEGESVLVAGVVRDVHFRTLRGGRSMFTALIDVGDGLVKCVWFNQPFRSHQLAKHAEVAVQGKVRRRGVSWEFSHPRVIPLEEQAPPTDAKLQPIYPLAAGITQQALRARVRRALDQWADSLEEAIPSDLLHRNQLPTIANALRQVHFPATLDEAERARERFVYQELLTLQLALGMRRAQRQRRLEAPALEATPRIDARIRRRFPFALTGDQNQAIGDIVHDMAQKVPMARLLQGDVGSGKTVVAQYAMLLAVAHGHQAALMAPTEVLARQHARTLFANLRGSRVRTALWIGSMTDKEKSRVRDRLSAGDVDLLIGTQALTYDELPWQRLGLVVIDEQHRFGVLQRAVLRHGAREPHYLVMTATPIPRTVALALYGDFDVSTLREKPPGRQPVKTYWVQENQSGSWWSFVRRKLAQGRQAMVVTPRVEGDEQGEVAGVEEVMARLHKGPLAGYRFASLHGRLSTEEKDRVMIEFAQGAIDVLVATTVVEVGIDVANLAVLTIEHAERFGLAQLHQLRGRVGRGQHPGFVGFFADAATQAAIDRLTAFLTTDDGFAIAESDFRLRGPGELLGTKQHGRMPLRIADLQRDQEWLATARDDAQAILREDDDLSGNQWRLLRERLIKRFADVLELAEIG